MLDRARAQPRVILAEREQRILLPLVREQAEQQPLADAEHREHHLFGADLLQQALEHDGAVGQHLAARGETSSMPGSSVSFLVLRTMAQNAIVSAVGSA